ncbi:MAG: glycosyltransferase [Paludibacteraceae bacterium]|nr:glycosyltransferase [Paludibacteraceae bacterium]
MQISVIIPTYQPRDYLWQCLDALRQQTLPSNQWEVILILNGPKEPYLSAIQEHISNLHSSNIRLLYTDQAGVSHARNIGLDNAQGEYITFIDDDDYVSPAFLEELLSQATPQIVSLCNVHAFSDEQTHLPNYFEDAYLEHANGGLQPFYKARKFFSSACLKLIHRNIIANRRFNEHYKNGEDSLFMFLISDKLSQVQFTSPNAIYYRRVRTNSASTRVNKRQQISYSIHLIGAYHKIYRQGNYLFRFYITRLLAAIHTILTH